MSIHPTKTTTRWRWLAAAIASMVGLTAVVLTADPAWATSGYTYWGPAASYGFYNYNPSNTTTTIANLRLIAAPGTLASGKCYDQILDWKRVVIVGNSHYDSRLARSCKSSTQRDTQVSHESNNVDLESVQKLGVCYGTNQATNKPVSNCKTVTGSLANIDTNVGATKFCVRAWSMTPAGATQFFSGGVVTSCTS